MTQVARESRRPDARNGSIAPPKCNSALTVCLSITFLPYLEPLLLFDLFLLYLSFSTSEILNSHMHRILCGFKTLVWEGIFPNWTWVRIKMFLKTVSVAKSAGTRSRSCPLFKVIMKFAGTRNRKRLIGQNNTVIHFYFGADLISVISPFLPKLNLYLNFGHSR